jgi:uncharacterized protein YqiB (DUF1249 family)
MIYETIFKKLLKLIPDLKNLEVGDNAVSITEGYMNLNLDVLAKGEDGLVIALSHYYRHDSGDMIPDPDMEIRVYLDQQMAEALAYQDFFGFDRVYHEPMQINISAKQRLNAFLDKWLSNCLSQGHKLTQKQEG